MRLITINEIDRDIAKVRRDHAAVWELMGSKKRKRVLEDIQFYEACKAYLLTSPSLEYLIEVRQRLSDKVGVIVADRYHPMSNDLAKLKYQLRIHDYILN